MRIVKWVFGGLAAVVVVLGLAWVMVPKDRIINFALDWVEAQTGRYISVGGDAELKIFPNLVVVADQVSVANADWSDRGAMMSADRLDISSMKDVPESTLGYGSADVEDRLGYVVNRTFLSSLSIDFLMLS
jgi:uncharacterized protein involved in outer membrane biogenesis